MSFSSMIKVPAAVAIVVASILHSRIVMAAPATQQEALSYTNMGAMTICFLNALDVSFDKAMQASSTAMMRVLVDQHDSAMLGQDFGRKPTEEEVREAAVIQLAIRTDELCGEKFKGSNKNEIDRVLELIKERFAHSKQV